MPKVHIGKKIREVFDKTGLTVVDFAKSISLTRDGAYKVFNKETIDTGQLQKIGRVLNHNFFSYYEQLHLTQVKEAKPEYGYATRDELSELTHTVKLLAKEIEKLREELPKKKTAPKHYAKLKK